MGKEDMNWQIAMMETVMFSDYEDRWKQKIKLMQRLKNLEIAYYGYALTGGVQKRLDMMAVGIRWVDDPSNGLWETSWPVNFNGWYCYLDEILPGG